MLLAREIHPISFALVKKFKISCCIKCDTFQNQEKVLRLMLKLEALWAISGVWCISKSIKYYRDLFVISENRTLQRCRRNAFDLFVNSKCTWGYQKIMFDDENVCLFKIMQFSNLNVNKKINYHIHFSRHDLSRNFSRYFIFLVVHRVESLR